jgi:hypothetical protein
MIAIDNVLVAEIKFFKKRRKKKKKKRSGIKDLEADRDMIH